MVDRLVILFRAHGDPAALRAASGYIRTAQAELVQDHITALIHRQSAAADMAFYESPEFYDHLHRARSEASYRPIALVETLGSLLQNGITLIAMSAVLAAYGPWIPAILLLCTLPALYVVLRYAVEQHQWRRRVTSDERRIWYYDWLLNTAETAAELRLFGLGEYFHALYQQLRARLRSERLGLARRQGLRLMRDMLQNVGQLYANILFLGNLFEFLALEPKVVSPGARVAVPHPLADGVRFSGITFRYPASERPALEDFHLVVPAGSIAAVVGPNGAGKTTLLKLLCRFYDPQAGSITLDGTDLRAFSVEDLRRRITVLFQQPVRYSATARDNIALGDLNASPPDADIRAAAQAAGAEESILRLPRGYDSLLGKWFEEGAELSTGEWQRLALARHGALRQSGPARLLRSRSAGSSARRHPGPPPPSGPGLPPSLHSALALGFRLLPRAGTPALLYRSDRNDERRRPLEPPARIFPRQLRHWPGVAQPSLRLPRRRHRAYPFAGAPAVVSLCSRRQTHLEAPRLDLRRCPCASG